MASSTVLSRLSSRVQPLALKLSRRSSVSHELSLLKSSSHSQVSAPARRISRISRLPLELSSTESMMPLHSAVASSRLTSMLSIESQSWGLIPQGDPWITMDSLFGHVPQHLNAFMTVSLGSRLLRGRVPVG
ncbi:hypothetical protein L1049_001181 [Liquidambar formosana]|uniref:Protein NUCLEAR FUSION DEFECTIVE 6, chloroplastic/mitochondrial-like n=1 Tax=Liquidambar formosana TaxID=63359 RepID=A0AAP0NB19_LIQFO